VVAPDMHQDSRGKSFRRQAFRRVYPLLSDTRAVDHIVDQYKRAIKIVNKYQNAEIKLIDCPLLSIRHWNKNKGHPKPETFKVDDFPRDI
jgi:hypothetical protein